MIILSFLYKSYYRKKKHVLMSSSFNGCFRIQISTTLSNIPGRGITFFDLLEREREDADGWLKERSGERCTVVGIGSLAAYAYFNWNSRTPPPPLAPCYCHVSFSVSFTSPCPSVPYREGDKLSLHSAGAPAALKRPTAALTRGYCFKRICKSWANPERGPL